jgi:hypothetical protein
MTPNRPKQRWSQWQNHTRQVIRSARKHRLVALILQLLKRLHFSFVRLSSVVFRSLTSLTQTFVKQLIQILHSLYRFLGSLKPNPPLSPQPTASTISDEDPYPFADQSTALRSFIRSHVHHIIALLFLVIAFSFILAFFIPVSISFEGNIITRQVSFTTRTQNNQLLINSLRSISRLEIEGLQVNPLTLWGEFATDDPTQDISEFSQLEMTLNSPDSKLIFDTSFYPSNPDNPNELEIQSLRLQPGTRVRNLAYDPERHQLSLTLNPPHDENPDHNTQKTSIQLSLGGNSLQVIAEYVKSPQLQFRPSDNTVEEQAEQAEIFDYNQEKFSWTPYNTELNLIFQNEITLYIDLPDLETSEYQDWFWGGFEVTDVDFTYNTTTANVPDELVRSTILQGQIKFLNQDLPLEAEQFLVLPSSSNIQRIPRLKLHPQSPTGLQVRIQGKTDEIAVGLDPNFPVRRLKSNFWEQRLPRDLIGILLTICSVMIGYLIPWLFT